ncbi:unnamed protein product [Caenorhabditis brenneri]
MIPSATEALYQSCYCEENVYKLFERIAEEHRQHFYAVFISNHDKMIPLWSQKAARAPGEFVMWDYHVIAIRRGVHEEGEASKVYDLDSVLEWGVDFRKYWEETMRMEEMRRYQPIYRRKFRIIPAEQYLTLFSSDRSHMLGPDGNYLQPPPLWPLINSSGIPSNLMKILDFEERFENTMVMDEDEFPKILVPILEVACKDEMICRELYSCRCPTGCQFPVVDADGIKGLFKTPSPTQACRAQHLHKKRPDYEPEVLRTMCQKPDPCGDKGPTEEMLLRYSLCPTMYLWKEKEAAAILFPTVAKKYFDIPDPAKNRHLPKWIDCNAKFREVIETICSSKLAIVFPYPLPEDGMGHLQSAVSSVSEKTDLLLVAAPGKEAGDDLEELVLVMDDCKREAGKLHVILPTETVEEMEGKSLWSTGKELRKERYWQAIEWILQKNNIQWPCLQKPNAPPPQKKRKGAARLQMSHRMSVPCRGCERNGAVHDHVAESSVSCAAPSDEKPRVHDFRTSFSLPEAGSKRR